jgi:hypothetical protein
MNRDQIESLSSPQWHDPDYWSLFDPEAEQEELHSTAIKEVTELADKVVEFLASCPKKGKKKEAQLREYANQFGELCHKYDDLGMADTEPRAAFADILIDLGHKIEAQWFRYPEFPE